MDQVVMVRGEAVVGVVDRAGPHVQAVNDHEFIVHQGVPVVAVDRNACFHQSARYDPVHLAVFPLIKAINKLRRKEGEATAEPTTKACPYCCTDIPLEAVRCPHCTSELKDA